MEGINHTLKSPRKNGGNNSQEPRHSVGSVGVRVPGDSNHSHIVGGTTKGNAMRRILKLDPETEKENKMRLKKKMLMSDSLNMLTKQRNQFIN